MQAVKFISRVRSATIRTLAGIHNQKLAHTQSTGIQLLNNHDLNHITSRAMSSEPTYTADYLSEKLKTKLQAEHIDIQDLSNCGCGMKFHAQIVSPQFEGKPLLQRQRLVNQVLDEEMKHIHAFTMKTLTPKEWTQNK